LETKRLHENFTMEKEKLISAFCEALICQLPGLHIPARRLETSFLEKTYGFGQFP
jgi:hypothetical protein